MTTYLFLDIDGVLNSEAYWNRPEVRAKGFYERSFDPECVARLNQLVEASGAVIVLSSSWRTRAVKDAQDLFDHVGIKGLAVGVTPWLFQKDTSRGKEIATWCEAHIVSGDRLVILDDGDDMGPMRRFLIQTDHKVGLQDADVEKALWLLGNKRTLAEGARKR